MFPRNVFTAEQIRWHRARAGLHRVARAHCRLRPPTFRMSVHNESQKKSRVRGVRLTTLYRTLYYCACLHCMAVLCIQLNYRLACYTLSRKCVWATRIKYPDPSKNWLLNRLARPISTLQTRNRFTWSLPPSEAVDYQWLEDVPHDQVRQKFNVQSSVKKLQLPVHTISSMLETTSWDNSYRAL